MITECLFCGKEVDISHCPELEYEDVSCAECGEIENDELCEDN